MKKDLTQILICPACLPHEYSLLLSASQAVGDDVIEGQLNCAHCGRVYLIQEGVAIVDPGYSKEIRAGYQYESPAALSAYLWSHFCDWLEDPHASTAYAEWAELMEGNPGFCLDIGSATGRFSFEMSRKYRFVVGIEKSLLFVRTARELMSGRIEEIELVDEGVLKRKVPFNVPGRPLADNVEFIVADALGLPFRTDFFSGVASLNVLDKISHPMKHLVEMNRVATVDGAEVLLSDPFSWSTDVATKEDWLGGKMDGDFGGRGIENVAAILKGEKGSLLHPWEIKDDGHVWWKIRNHSNHFELIRSRYVRAVRRGKKI